MWTTPIYHPRGNPTERRNQEIKKGLRISLLDRAHNKWNEKIPEILFHLRNRRNESTGHSPAELMLSYQVKGPEDHDRHLEEAELTSLEEWIRAKDAKVAERLSRATQRMIKKTQGYVKEQTYKPSVQFRIGEQVWIDNHQLSNAVKGFNASLAPKRLGPYTITQKLSPYVYTIDKGNREVKVYARQMTKYNPRVNVPLRLNPAPASGEEGDIVTM